MLTSNLLTTQSNNPVSKLGFGLMRLPVENGEIDIAKTRRMVKRAIEAGINYFDTAYPYHDGKSELIIGEILKDFKREEYCLVTKFPGHEIRDTHDPKGVFEHQLQKCQVDYFDYYLLHNVNEQSIYVYLDKEINIIPYFLDQVKSGRIKHLGFSTHGSAKCIKKFLDSKIEYNNKSITIKDVMELCQIQYNYVDAKMQKADEKYNLLVSYNIPVVVMEPVRGGKLAEPDEALQKLRPNDTIASFAFRWLLEKENIAVILSGMSNEEQLEDNLKTFYSYVPLTEEEKDALDTKADNLTHFIPCTGCKYCLDSCPKNLNIPFFMSSYNEAKFGPYLILGMQFDFISAEEQPDQCIKCRKCEQICPQNIKIADHIEELISILKTIPKWADLCREREEASKKLREGK
ncbi:MAG: 4Fe-4S dicluster domain-containing protein [Ruminococcaceae bacterium]|nr:4Fe-4S dicluster domain-containing protein [Oscillospiraceae bacterium]